MKTVAIESQKGGTGKTTTALNLAVAAEKAGQATVVIDLDPQASAAGWKDTRQAESPVVVSVPPARLPQALQAAQEGGADPRTDRYGAARRERILGRCKGR